MPDPMTPEQALAEIWKFMTGENSYPDNDPAIVVARVQKNDKELAARLVAAHKERRASDLALMKLQEGMERLLKDDVSSWRGICDTDLNAAREAQDE